ncbi:MAG TPA: histone deacetylase [Thermoanaerobaculia bacterium]|nr:histone deacetylase [Thermoanaerobaculia bacterium]
MLLKTLRRLSRLGRAPRVQLVYSRRYQIELPGAVYDPQRGERILAFLDSAGLLDPAAAHPAEPVPFPHLRRIHTDDYLDSLNRPETLVRIVGLQLSEDALERILEAQRTMVGGTLAATRLARASNGIAVNLGGGLHHAFADRGARFCVYNDVAAAVAELRSRNVASRVLVVDLDLHDGDGTRAIFAGDPAVHTFSIHNHTSAEVNAAESTVIELGTGVGDDAYLAAVRTRLPPVFESFKPELVFYLAGCDPAADDEIGDWRISAEALLERDQFVLSCVRGAQSKGRNCPLVIMLAGGYGPNAWRYSARFLSSLLNRGRAVEPPSTEELLLTRYRLLARGFEEHELTGEPRREDDWGLSDDDLISALGGPRRPRRLLGFYSRQGLELTLERVGLLDRIRNLGFERPTLEIDLDNPAGDTARLYGGPGRRDLLIELRVRIDRGTLTGMTLLRIEWLLLQNPRAQFTTARPRLPGQEHPGLGMLKDVVALLILACDRLQLDGLIVVPSRYHVAVHARKSLRFLDPRKEGLYHALQRPLEKLSLAEASAALAGGRVVDTRTGEPLAWHPTPMVFPVSDRFREMLDGEEYQKGVAEGEGGYEIEVR